MAGQKNKALVFENKSNTVRFVLYAVLSLVLFVSIFLQGFLVDAATAQKQDTAGFGVITDALSDGRNLYFFEVDDSVEKKETWIKNAKARVYENFASSKDKKNDSTQNDGGKPKIFDLSQEHFALPTELQATESHLYFAVLADSCMGKIRCDYQNIVRMSKETGGMQTIASDLKSAIHLSIPKSPNTSTDSPGKNSEHEKFLYVSESSGSLWRINLQDPAYAKDLVWETDNIVMKMTATSKGQVFWIEEELDKTNTVKMVRPKPESNILNPFDNAAERKAVTLETGLQKPISIRVSGQNVYWKDLVQGGDSEGKSGKATLQAGIPTAQVVISSYDLKDKADSTESQQQRVKKAMEYARHNPFWQSLESSHKKTSSSGDSVYGTSYISDGYVFLVNKTSRPYVIQMKGLGENDGKTHDLAYLKEGWVLASGSGHEKSDTPVQDADSSMETVESKIRYMRNDDHTLYVFAEYTTTTASHSSEQQEDTADQIDNENSKQKRYTVKKFALPVVVPEFPENSFLGMIAIFVSFAVAMMFGVLLNNKYSKRLTDTYPVVSGHTD